MSKAGVSFRGPLGAWLDRAPPAVECVEVIAEHFYSAGRGRVRLLGEKFPLFLHTERLSLGTPGPLDERELGALATLVSEVRPRWVSDHLGFRCTSEVDLGSPVPMLLDERSLDLMAERVQRVMDVCRLPLLLENLSSPLVIQSPFSEPEFLNRLCERTGCGVLLDVTALFVSSRNLGFDPLRWLHELDPGRIVQVHVGGCRERDGCWEDAHAGPVHEDVWALLGDVLSAGLVEAVVLERDASFPPPEELTQELRRIKSLTHAGDGIGTGV